MKRAFHWLTRIAGATLLAGAALSAKNLLSFDPTIVQVVAFVVVPLACGLIFWNVFSLPKAVVQIVFACIICAVIGIYAFEVTFQLSERSTPDYIAQVEEKYGITFDRRTPLQVVKDLRNEGTMAYPNLLRHYGPNPLKTSAGLVVPLSNRADAEIVECNEFGSYQIRRTDHLGFFNPPSAYLTSRVTAVFIGDSFTEGYCTEENFVALVRRERADVLNFGIGASGTLVELGIFLEYAVDARPRYVFWVFSENDLTDLILEQSQPQLRAYLSGETQGLAGKQGAIDAAVDAFMPDLLNASNVKEESFPWIDFLLLRGTRGMFGLSYRVAPPKDISDPRVIRESLPLFREIMQMVRDRSAEIGANLVFVYLPTSRHHFGDFGPPSRFDFLYRDDILRIVAEEGIEHIDLMPAIRDMENPRENIWVVPTWGHFTPSTYRVVADQIIKRLANVP